MVVGEELGRVDAEDGGDGGGSGGVRGVSEGGLVWGGRVGGGGKGWGGEAEVVVEVGLGTFLGLLVNSETESFWALLLTVKQDTVNKRLFGGGGLSTFLVNS